MKVVLIGVGQAGGKLTQALAEFDHRMGFDAIRGALAVNSAKADLQSLSIDTCLVGQARVNGHGVGGDNELGAEVMQEDTGEVMGQLDGRITAEAEGIFVVAGLGGGTGSGGAPVLVRELARIYDIPVYALGVLPGRDEGAMYQANAGRSLKTLVREADSTLLVDNDAWHSSGDSVGDAFDAINRAIAQRVGLLLASGEAIEGVGESVVDSSEVINTFKEGDIAALGYASAAASEDSAENVTTTMSTARQALFTGTSLPDARTADAALLVVAGRPEAIPRKGVERAADGRRRDRESAGPRRGLPARFRSAGGARVALGRRAVRPNEGVHGTCQGGQRATARERRRSSSTVPERRAKRSILSPDRRRRRRSRRRSRGRSVNSHPQRRRGPDADQRTAERGVVT